MSDNKVQASYKKPDGTIYVIAGDNFEEYAANALAVLQGDEDTFQALLDDMCRSFTPMATPAPAAGGYYTPQGGQPAPQQAGARIAQVPVSVKIPWAQKAQADPYLTPLKSSGQAKWDGTNKVWILSPGVDLTPFAAWLPPGS